MKGSRGRPRLHPVLQHREVSATDIGWDAQEDDLPILGPCSADPACTSRPSASTPFRRPSTEDAAPRPAGLAKALIRETRLPKRGAMLGEEKFRRPSMHAVAC